ncbi:hypothetical protein BGZ47_000614, partial [Haplosporangium gracile]
MKELKVAVSAPDDDDDFDNVWRVFLHQLGMLLNLQTLYLKCTELSKEPENLQGLVGAINLRNLTILDEEERQELHGLMTLPGLERLELSPLSVDDHVNVFLWLGET